MAGFNHCGLEVEKIVGRALSDKELADLEKSIMRRARERQRKNAGERAEDALRAAGMEIADELTKEKLIAKRAAMLNMRARIFAADYIMREFPGRPAEGLQAILVGTNRVRTGGRNSAAAAQNATSQHYTQKFMADVENAGYWKEFVSGAFDEEISDTVWKMGNGIDVSDASDVAKAIAKVVDHWNEYTRGEANAAGAWIGKEPGYIARQSHDMNKIRGAAARISGVPSLDEKANFKAWRDFVLPLLDGDRTFREADNPEAFLKSTWEALASGVHLMHSGGGESKGVPAGYGSIAKKMSHDRVLHFKDGKSWFQYNQKFGAGSLREAMLHGLSRMGKNTGLMSALGPNPAGNVERLYNDLMKATAKTQGVAGRKAFSDAKSSIDNWMAVLDGSINIPANAMGARWSANVRAVQSMAKLGGSVISSITDIPALASELRYQGFGFLDSYKAGFSGIIKGRPKEEQRQILGMLGIMNESMAGHMVQRFSAHDDLGGVMSSAMRTFFKYNGQTWWTDTMRSSAALAMSKNLADNAGRPFAELSEDLQRVMKLFAIDGDMWNMVSKHLDEAEGEKFLTPEAARRVDEKELVDYLKATGIKDPKKTQINNLRREIENKFRSYYVDRVEYAAMMPDARVQAIMKMGSRPGTWTGEFWRFITQFKAFPTTVLLKPIARDIWGRGIEEDKFGKAMLAAMTSGNGEAMAMAHYVVMSTAFGYMAMSAKDMLKGKTPRDPQSPKTWAAAMTQGGGLGIYGDFIFGEYNRFGRSMLASLAGPTLGQVDDVMELWNRMKNGDDVASASFRMGLNNTPFINMFYTRMALDYLIIYRIQEAMNPGYLKRMERRAEKENHQTFLVKPSDVVE